MHDRPRRRGPAERGARFLFAGGGAEAGRAWPVDLRDRRVLVLRDIRVAAGREVRARARAWVGCDCCVERLLDPGSFRYVALRRHDGDQRRIEAAAEGLQRALVRLVGGVARDRERFEPFDLAAGDRADHGQDEPDGDDGPPATKNQACKPGHTVLSVAFSVYDRAAAQSVMWATVPTVSEMSSRNLLYFSDAFVTTCRTLDACRRAPGSSSS